MFSQMSGYERIAAISAVLRGHELGEWRFQESFAVANCVRCGRELLVHNSLVEPDMDGGALDHRCVNEYREIRVRVSIRL